MSVVSIGCTVVGTGFSAAHALKYALICCWWGYHSNKWVVWFLFVVTTWNFGFAN